MSLFPETIAASLGGARVQAAWLARFEFASETMRLWRGHGLHKAKDGTEWQGLGRLGDIAGIEQAINGEAPQATFTLSGIDADVLRLARDEFKAEVLGRRGVVSIQFFGEPDEADPDNQRPLDLPYALWSGRFLQPTFALDKRSGERSIKLSAETLFSLRSRPKFAMNTDRDQQRRFPDGVDRGFEFVTSLISKVVTWPDY